MNIAKTCRFVLSILFVAGTLPVAASSHAQSYPTKPVRMIIPYPPGNSTSDILGRAVAQKLSMSLGQQVVVENKPGAGGMIGTEFVARSSPDGYTIVFGATGPIAINVSLYKQIAYDPVRDLAPISLVAITTSVLVVHPSVPAYSVKGLVKLAKSMPGRLTYGSAGIGGVNHLAGELFNTAAGVRLVHVPYRGMAPAVIDLLGGQIDLIFATMPGVLAHVKSGKLRPLAVATARRSRVLPELPTISEAALPGFEASAFFGFLAPAKTPSAVISKLSDQFDRILKSPDVRELFSSQGADPVGGTANEFSEFIQAEIRKWAKVIKASGATAN